MDKKEKIIDLQLKIIEINLEKEKDLYNSSFSWATGIIIFLITSGFLTNTLKNILVELVKNIISKPQWWDIIILYILIIIPPLLAGFGSKKLFDLFINSKKKIYEEKIKEINEVIYKLKTQEKGVSVTHS